ncbi:MAG: hypothetical protein IIX61_10185, partial [Loktanella sp.]|nr:hypothetical protein [Loktanella sp.]
MSIKDIFNTMDYGPALESKAEALAWLAAHDNLVGPFINAKWPPARNDFATSTPAAGETLAGLTKGPPADIAAAV